MIQWRGASKILIAASVLAPACGSGRTEAPEPIAIDTTGLVARGEYIVRNVAVCGHCHAAQAAQDADGPLSGGMAFRNWRLGAIRASNLTPDSATGLARWGEGDIITATRRGLRRDGQVLAPVMPYHWYNGMSDRDAAAVARYLKSQAPVRNEVDSDPNVVFLLGRFLFIQPERDRRIADIPRSMTEQYGEYLAVHVATCVDCHTPRGGIMAMPRTNRLFAGSEDKDFPANPSNITPDSASGIGTWSEADFIRTIRTGVNPSGRKLHPFMPWQQYRRMTDADLRTIYAYLRSVRPIRNEVPVRQDTTRRVARERR